MLRDMYKPDENSGFTLGTWISSMKDALAEFIQAVRKDTGANFVDETIQRYFPITKKSLFSRIRERLFPSEGEKTSKRLNDLAQKAEKSQHDEKYTPKKNKHEP
jgi:hypothetical protein